MSLKRSELSGQPIEGDAGQTVVIHLGDGRRIELRVTAQEADDLAAKGRDVTLRSDRAVGWIRKRAWKIIVWGAALLVASVVIPAATKQWSDRQAALALRADLIENISRSSAIAFTGAKRVAAMSAVPKARAKRLETRDAWEAAEGTIDAIYAVYFRDTAARDVWLAYRNEMYSYISLGCCDEEFREADIALLRKYLVDIEPLSTGSDPWGVIACGSGEGCAVASEFERSYTRIGIKLLGKRGHLLSELRRTKPAGFSLGWRDLVTDVLPLV